MMMWWLQILMRWLYFYFTLWFDGMDCLWFEVFLMMIWNNWFFKFFLFLYTSILVRNYLISKRKKRDPSILVLQKRTDKQNSSFNCLSTTYYAIFRIKSMRIFCLTKDLSEFNKKKIPLIYDEALLFWKQSKFP
jgi:hypothetical protein